MSERLASARSLTVTAHRRLDPALVPGAEVAEDAQIEVALRRPDQLRPTASTEDGTRQLYFDGQTFTILDEAKNLYASQPVEGTIDDLIARLSEGGASDRDGAASTVIFGLGLTSQHDTEVPIYGWPGVASVGFDVAPTEGGAMATVTLRTM